MIRTSSRAQLLVAASLALLLIVTRNQHFASLHNLPGAAWAVFFLAGVYLRPVWALPLLLVVTVAIDWLAFATDPGSRTCLTPAYAFLVPAYAALWLGGRWYARRHFMTPANLVRLIVAAALSSASAELFSSGGFYWFSGYFPEPTWAEFAQRLAQYFPATVRGLLFYLAVAALIHVALAGVATSDTYRRKAG